VIPHVPTPPILTSYVPARCLSVLWRLLVAVHQVPLIRSPCVS